jgi:two-component system response regulator AtoC
MTTSRILIVDDEPLQRWALKEQLVRWGYEVLEADSGQSALELYRTHLPDVVLLDLRLGAESGLDVLKEIKAVDPAAAVIMVTAHGDLDDAVSGFRLGLTDFFSKPVDFAALRVALRYRLEARRLRAEVDRRRQRDQTGQVLVGQSPAFLEAVRTMEKVAASGATTVLLQGESGTGKDLFARALHDRSSRCEEPFVAVNCAALPDTLLETELFGHERGAFTDARTMKRGMFELADRGTLYLDEVGELKLPLQAKLLRVLEELAFRRVGGVHDIRVDVRVVAASNRDLARAVEEGQFRADLFYRLGVVQICLPPLRERREDVPLLVEHFVGLLGRRLRRPIKGVTPEAMAALCQYDWPGNARELRNVLERALILEDQEVLTTRYLPSSASRGAPAGPVRAQGRPGATGFVLPPEGVSLERVEEDLVRQAMQLADGNQTRAARLLDISRDALRYKLKKFGIPARDGEEPASGPAAAATAPDRPA